MNVSDLLKSTVPKYNETIPSSGKQIWFRPFFVKEEKILLIAQETAKEIEILHAIKSVIENCFDGIEDASILPIFDLEYLFLKLRSKSVQEVVTPILECPITQEKIKLTIQLDEIKVKTFENHNKIIKINDTIIVGMKYPSLSLFLEKNIMDMSLMNFYDMAINCIEYIETPTERMDFYEKSNIEDFKQFVDSMTKEQFDKIIQFFATMPRIEHVVEYKTSDGVIREVVLRGIRDFFE